MAPIHAEHIGSSEINLDTPEKVATFLSTITDTEALLLQNFLKKRKPKDMLSSDRMEESAINKDLLSLLEQTGGSASAFVAFLVNNGYEVKKANPAHRPGQGYSAAPYYGNITINTAVEDYIERG